MNVPPPPEPVPGLRSLVHDVSNGSHLQPAIPLAPTTKIEVPGIQTLAQVPRTCERCRKTGRTCEPREGALACVGCNASRVACSLVGEIQGTSTRRASPTKKPTNKKRGRSPTPDDAAGSSAEVEAKLPSTESSASAAKKRRTDEGGDESSTEEMREVIMDLNRMHNDIGRKLGRLNKLWERKHGSKLV